MPKTTPEQNKTIVLEAFNTLFNKRDYAAAERFWSPKYIQHSAHIAPGREGLFALVRSSPDTLHYENQLIDQIRRMRTVEGFGELSRIGCDA
jgi:predicted SnoaL-like aldol condensation-catalyzing enzyme